MFNYSRRFFLKNSILSSAVLIMHSSNVYGVVQPIETIALVQEDLFPFAKKSAVDTNSYLNIIFNHSRVSDEDKMFIRNGVQWLNEESVKKYKKAYMSLDARERQSLLQIISKERWGESWIETLLSYIMEAMFSDKVYGVNPNEAGQKWLNHSNGLPSPKEALL